MRLTLIHSELNATYGLRANLAASLRLPYDIKQQRVHYTTLTGEPFTPPYGDIHHRSETLTGISDGSLLLRWQIAQWQFAAGTTLPLGHTVEDPVALGRAGLKHEHLQFGSGVFAPELEVSWRRTVVVQATIPVTTSSRGFRAPVNIRWSAGPTFRRVSVTATGQYQSVGRWHGEADEGTGFVNGGLRAGVALPFGRTTIAPSVYRELYSHGLHDEVFSQGTTVAVGLSRKF